MLFLAISPFLWFTHSSHSKGMIIIIEFHLLSSYDNIISNSVFNVNYKIESAWFHHWDQAFLFFYLYLPIYGSLWICVLKWSVTRKALSPFTGIRPSLNSYMWLLPNLFHQSHTVLEADLVSSSHLSGSSIAHAVEELAKCSELFFGQRLLKGYTQLVKLVRELSRVNITRALRSVYRLQ